MMIYYQSQSRIHKIHNNHGCTITMNWFRRTCKESKTTLYYWLHKWSLCNLQVYWEYIFLLFFFCLSFLQKPAWLTGYENPPNKCAKITRQKNPPVKSAMKTCQIYVWLKPAGKTSHFNSRLACQRTPFPAQNPQAGPGPPSLSPPRQLRQRSRERGQGAGPAHPRILNRYSHFHSLFHEWLHILMWHNIYIFYTERINMKV